MKCEDCLDTGWVGDNGPGKNGNNEYMPCDCEKGKAIAISIRNRPASEIPTAELIAELDRRSPCSPKCKHYQNDKCDCIWYCRIDGFESAVKDKP